MKRVFGFIKHITTYCFEAVAKAYNNEYYMYGGKY